MGVWSWCGCPPNDHPKQLSRPSGAFIYTRLSRENNYPVQLNGTVKPLKISLLNYPENYTKNNYPVQFGTVTIRDSCGTVKPLKINTMTETDPNYPENYPVQLNNYPVQLSGQLEPPVPTPTKRPKTGGRVAGKPNRITTRVRWVIAEALEREMENLPALLETLTPRERLFAIVKLAPFVLPETNNAHPWDAINPHDWSEPLNLYQEQGEGTE